jgi:hypothetical protein
MAYSWIGISPISISNVFHFSFLEAQTKYLRPYRDNIDEQRSNATRAQLDRRILLREATFFAVSAESTRVWIPGIFSFSEPWHAFVTRAATLHVVSDRVSNARVGIACKHPDRTQRRAGALSIPASASITALCQCSSPGIPL